MQKLISIIAVVVIVATTVFVTSACKNCGKKDGACSKHEMCCKKDCCDKCDGKACCEGKDCKAHCEKMCAEGKCCSSDSTACEKSGDKKACCKKGDKKEAGAAAYACPMHPDITSEKPDTCSKCGMDLEKK